MLEKMKELRREDRHGEEGEEERARRAKRRNLHRGAAGITISCPSPAYNDNAKENTHDYQ